MKKISFLIPCYNEEDNVVPLAEAIKTQLEPFWAKYDYEIVFIDNCSYDSTRDKLRSLCAADKHIKAIFNAKNFGQFNSPYYGLCQTTGDCTISMCADFQDPVELIPQMIAEWEKGYKIVACIKSESEENKLVRFLRTCYYKAISKMSSIEQIEHFTGFGLYDKTFIDVLRELDDPIPFLRGIVAEMGANRKDLYYKQAKRRSGHTSNNWYSLYDAAMLSFTTYTKFGLRMATLGGFAFAFISFLFAMFFLIRKLLFWDQYGMGTAPLLVGLFFVGSIQLLFMGFIGEYLLTINARVMKRPLVIEECRINFD